MTPRLALAGLVLAAPLLGAASCETPAPRLAPIPAPAPVVVHVPTYVALPADATAPCVAPSPRKVQTDVDLLQVAAAWRVTAKCNENKLRAIEAAQP